MNKQMMFCLLIMLVMLFTTSCIVRSSLAYSDKDTDGVPNLLSNPGFNAYSLDPDEALLGWSLHAENIGKGKISAAIDPKEALQGNTSLRIDASDQTVTLISDAFKVRRYGGFYSRVFVKSSEKVGPQVCMKFTTFRDNGSVYNQFKHKQKTTNEWGKNSISAGYLKPGVSFGRLQIIIPPFSEGSVWIDDAGCWEVHQFRID